MSRSRFNMLLALVGVVVAAGAFLVGLTVFDDDGTDAPPRAAAGDDDATDDGGAAGGAETTTTSTPSAEVRTEALPSPSWIVVITSESTEATATSVATSVAGDGHPAGVLRSDEYPSLNPGFWVSYVGPFDSAATATDAAATLTSEGRQGVYVRCAGARSDCNPSGGSGGNGDGDEDDDD